jgi:fused signal recognition particle receptor
MPETSMHQPNRLFDRLKRGLNRTKDVLFTDVDKLFSGRDTLDPELIDTLEERLLMADLGINVTSVILEEMQNRKSNGESLEEKLQQSMLHVLEPVDQPLNIPAMATKPFIILMAGVNGVGKTTSIGKLAAWLQLQGKSVMLAAGDTYRAAAIEQLQNWGERNGVPVVAQHKGADSAAVIFDALQSARSRNIDVLIADTAGRLHTQGNLMDELKKIRKVINKFDPDIEPECLLVLDAGTGQNALVQARQFNEAIGVTGIMLTKLDGTAKGGIIFALAKELGIPIRFIGVGEQADDLQVFNSKDFIQALFTN